MSAKAKDKKKSYSDIELKKLLENLQEQKKGLFEIKQKVRMGTHNQFSDIKKLKKEIARINTAITLKQKQEG
jgi:ribosomal protein L29